MGATLVLFLRNRTTGQMEEHGEPLHFDDELANSGIEKAQRYGDRWQQKGPGDHSYEIHRDS